MADILVNILFVFVIIAVVIIAATAYIISAIKRQSEAKQKMVVQTHIQMAKWTAESEQTHDYRSLETIPATEYDTKTVFQPVQPTIHKAPHKHLQEKPEVENGTQKGSDNTRQSLANELFEETDIRKAIIMSEILAPKFDKE